LSKEGCNIVAADIDFEGAQRTADEIEALGCQTLAVKVDVTQRAEIDAMVKKVLEKFGKIDILVNNAGASSKNKPFIEMTKADWDIDINVNLYGQMNVAQAVLPHMISRHYGRIINTTGGMGFPSIAVYGAAKAGVVAFTQSLAKEVAPLGVIVNVVAPGLALTGLVQGAPPEFLEMIRQSTSLKRFCTPEDLAPVVAFLASDVCSYMVGQCVSLAGS
jgi:NAD(P)-dependent dehydrogenase (short-subunit alcohol dehydrogenase family)